MCLAAEFLLPGDTSIIEVEAKTEKKSFQNKLNDEFVLASGNSSRSDLNAVSEIQKCCRS